MGGGGIFLLPLQERVTPALVQECYDKLPTRGWGAEGMACRAWGMGWGTWQVRIRVGGMAYVGMGHRV
jgi:hypothetical protein